MGYILEFKDEFDKKEVLEKLHNMKEDLCEICEMLEDADTEEGQMQERGRMMRRGTMRRRGMGRMRDERMMRGDMGETDYRDSRYGY